MPRLIILGSGTPVPTAKRWGTSFLLQLKDDWLMVDCGPGSTYKMHQMGILPTQISHLFFTHYHSDHMADYPCFLMTRFEQAVNEEDLNVYGPPPIKNITAGLWSKERGIFWLDVVARTQHPMSLDVYHRRGGVGHRPEPVVHVNEYNAGKVGSGKNWDCYAYEVEHAQPYLECYGLRFETAEGIIAFSGDAAPTDVLVNLARNADLFVMAAMDRETIRGEAVGAKKAREAGAKRLVITHQSPSLTSSNDLINDAIYDIKRVFTGPVYWGQDMMEISW